MAGFRKAKAEQAALKFGMFGPAGSGKTFTALLLAEGLAAHEGKRVAVWDTEHGSDFYAMEVPQRRHHPATFDFDAIYTRSITEGCRDIFALKPAEYGAVVIDSMTHLWEATIAAYGGPKMRNGQIPMQAWGKIKKPYKELMAWVVNSPFHVLILGRQANEWGADDETGETVAAGVKMKAEGETAYEPHILLRMEGVKPLRADGKSVKKNAEAIPTMFVVKDRTGVLQGTTIEYPSFETVAAPLLGLLGKTQARVQSEDDAAAQDVAALAQAERERATKSREYRREYRAKFELCKTPADVEALGKTITPDMKKGMLPADVDGMRADYQAAADRVKGIPPQESTHGEGDTQ